MQCHNDPYLYLLDRIYKEFKRFVSPLVLGPAVQGPLQRSPVTTQARQQGIDLTLHGRLDLWGPGQTNINGCQIKKRNAGWLRMDVKGI